MMHEQPGAAMVSVDWNVDAGGGTTTPRHAEEMLARLLELLDRYEVPAAWNFPEPAEAGAAARVLQSHAGHEAALLGDATWVGQAAGRPRFATELSRRMAAAGAAGLSIHALAICDSRVPRDHYDLLIKHGIRVVRQPRTAAGRASGPVTPQTLRHGVWEIPPSALLPSPDAWWGRGAGAARAAVRRSCADAIAHIVLDAGRLASEDPRLRSVESVLRMISRRRGAGILHSATLTSLAQEWRRPAAAAPTRSILRAA